ncbi:MULTISPECIES: MarR family transcriptional regulator [unclassified Curtobacterium]|jgi:DNA-binding MarR family transcriptional regulator|uniref:MarR family winged helix-turn-helix transcriptional regulator n=1 Tax=unclassified Curtobacterium TaxID=257496 RepID=UPI00286050CA|nr:MarR family transcriptional regulator [Curtobacterium sp. 320]MDR6573539.1 DNA-binding MarR family transcriptional regulator [Curtobacterium sp. 320]
MTSDNQAPGTSDLFAHQPRTAAGAAAILSLEALGDSVHDADEQALRALGMLPVDALALRHLVLARRDGRALKPTQLARLLHLSTAGVTKLIDRLVRDGRAERQPNPVDRRSIIVTAAGTAEQDLTRAYGHVRTPLVETIDTLTEDELTAVQRFASILTDALRQDAVPATSSNG